jgi:hypothetical protein
MTRRWGPGVRKEFPLRFPLWLRGLAGVVKGLRDHGTDQDSTRAATGQDAP